jgi:hypothetical protein
MSGGRGRVRQLVIALTLVVFGLGTAACGLSASKPTPIIVVIVDTPTPAPLPTTSPAASPTLAATPTLAAEPTPTAPPLVVVAASGCTGSAANKAFIAEVAGKMTWNVYCGVMPSGWAFSGGTYELAAGGRMRMAYRGPSGGILEVQEGAFCITDAAACSPRVATLQSVWMGQTPGTMVSRSDGKLAVYVSPGTPQAYEIVAAGVTQENLAAIVSVFAQVSKP